MKKNARRTIIVGKTQNIHIQDDEEDEAPQKKMEKLPCVSNVVAANTASSVEIIIQLFLEEMEALRMRIRGAGTRMRRYLVRNATETIEKVRRFIASLLARSAQRRSVNYKREEEVIFNQVQVKETFRPPKYTLNDIREVVLVDDLEDGVSQKRTPKWDSMPVRVKTVPVDDGLCEFQKLNVPMEMHFEEDDDRLSMPSTKTMMTTEDQMQAIHAQLAMLSRQLTQLQKSAPTPKVRKMASVDTGDTSESEDEGKGPSLCSPTPSRKLAGRDKKKQLAPMASAPPPPPPLPPSWVSAAPAAALTIPIPPPPPPPSMQILVPKVIKPEPIKIEQKVLPPEVASSDRPYLIDIVNGRHLLKKTIKSPGGSPLSYGSRPRRVLNSFEAALKERFRGFHGENSFSEQEEFGDEDEAADQVWND